MFLPFGHDSMPPGDSGETVRCTILLSCGTSRQSEMSPVMAPSMLLASPVAETLNSMHSFPACDGVHWNGPATRPTLSPAVMLAMLTWDVVIGRKSAG